MFEGTIYCSHFLFVEFLFDEADVACYDVGIEGKDNVECRREKAEGTKNYTCQRDARILRTGFSGGRDEDTW